MTSRTHSEFSAVVTEPSRLGKYAIDGVLGKGAMGIVYKATDPHIERTVAIKTVRKDLLDADLAAQFMGRFRNEARAAGRLHHPNIISIYEYGEDNDVAFIAMEYVDGTGLRDYLNRKARFDFAQIVAIVSQLLLALEYAHAQGVVHRDIKPANLILTAGGALKVADFGIARIDASNLTMTGMVMGTPSYMAPEQCRGQQNDHRADLFSAGVVLYELMTGVKPFTGSIETIAYKICHEDPRPPSEIATIPLPSSIDALVATALSKDPNDRFQHARAFNFALRLAAGDAAPSSASSDATVMNLADVPMRAPDGHVWDDASLATVERRLATFVGPMARILVRQAALQAQDARELYALLAEHIGDAGQRAKFTTQSGAGDASGSHGQRAADGGGSSLHGSSRPLEKAHSTHSTLARTRARRPLEQAFIDQTTSRLAVYLGPIARVVTRKAAAQARDSDEFVHLVAEHIGTQDRSAFLRELGADDD